MTETEQIEEDLVQFNEAKALKTLGLDVFCIGYYENQNKNLVLNCNNKPLTEEQQKRPKLFSIDIRNSTMPQWATTAPSYRQAFKFFRDKFNLEGHIKSWERESKIVYYFSINKIGKPSKFNDNEFRGDSHEAAELACLQKLIQTVKTK